MPTNSINKAIKNFASANPIGPVRCSFLNTTGFLVGVIEFEISTALRKNGSIRSHIKNAIPSQPFTQVEIVKVQHERRYYD